MGAETTVYVKVRRFRDEWIEVSAVTRTHAEEIARTRDGVVEVVESTYDKPPLTDRDPNRCIYCGKLIEQCDC